jgi:hypothetical protein
MQLTEALQNWDSKKSELAKTQNDIANGVDTWKVPSSLISEMSFYSGQISALKSVISLLEGEDNHCSQCEGKSDFPLSDMGFCAPCFDAQEEEDRLQEVNA